MPARPRGLPEPCAATSGTHGSEGPRRSNAPGLPDNLLHWVRDVLYDEDRSSIRSGNAPRVMATLRSTAISILRQTGTTTIAHATRHHSRDANRPVQLLLMLKHDFAGSSRPLPNHLAPVTMDQ